MRKGPDLPKCLQTSYAHAPLDEDVVDEEHEAVVAAASIEATPFSVVVEDLCSPNDFIMRSGLSARQQLTQP